MVSAVICAYNYERFVAEAIESALAQEYPADRLEVIVVDDGSTDGTPGVLRRFGDRIRVVRQENAGLNAATERGIREARGELIALLDADDAWRPDKVRRQVELLRARPEVGLVFSDKEIVDDHGERLHHSFFEDWGIEPAHGGARLGDLIVQNYVPAPTIMFRRALAGHVLPIAPAAACQDWWLAIRVAEVAELDWVHAPLTRYRIHGANMGAAARGEKQQSLLRRDNAFRRWILRELPLDQLDGHELYGALKRLADLVARVARTARTTHLDELPVSDTDRAEAESRLQAATAAAERGDLRAAVRELVAARAADPFHRGADAALERAYAAYCRHDEEAGAAALPPRPAEPAALLAWAEQAHAAGEPGPAIEALMSVADGADPALATAARVDLAVISFELDDHDTARRLAREVLAGEPAHAGALEVLAHCARAESDHVAATYWLGRATAAAPSDASLLRLLASSRAERAHWPQVAAALRAAEQLEDLAPEDAELLARAERQVAIAATAAAPDEPPAARGRALVVVDYYWPHVGGSERLAEGVGAALRGLGWSVEIACRALPQRTASRHRGMRIHEIARSPREELREIVRDRGIDAVIAFSDPNAWPVIATMHLPKPGPRRVVVPCVMPHNEQAVRGSLDNRRIWRSLIASADAVVHSSHGGRDARLHLDLGMESAVYVPNASEEIPPAGSLRAHLGIAPGVPLLLQVSNLSPQKNHTGLLEALAGHPGDFRLVMVGMAIAGQEAVAEQVLELAARDPRVTVVPGLDGGGVAAAMREADLLVHPSTSEGAPITILEAMSHGLPWLATPGCGAVHDHAGGLILPVREFGGAIDFLLADPAARARLGAAGRAHWEAAYTYDVIARRYDALLRGARRLPPLSMPAGALAATDEVRTAQYAATIAAPQAVGGIA